MVFTFPLSLADMEQSYSENLQQKGNAVPLFN
jgi:hypothetical protein